jgi:hypothetical protein
MQEDGSAASTHEEKGPCFDFGKTGAVQDAFH